MSNGWYSLVWSNLGFGSSGAHLRRASKTWQLKKPEPTKTKGWFLICITEFKQPTAAWTTVAAKERKHILCVLLAEHIPYPWTAFTGKRWLLPILLRTDNVIMFFLMGCENLRKASIPKQQQQQNTPGLYDWQNPVRHSPRQPVKYFHVSLPINHLPCPILLVFRSASG